MTTHDLVILGSGPAGMAAAAAAVAHGITAVVVDEQPAPGGQIYRSIETTPIKERRILGNDYWCGEELVDGLDDPRIDYRPGTTLWQLTRQLEVGLLQGDQASMVRARHVILAHGAMERPFPVPGWTLPGVMTAGSGQIMLKSGGLVPSAPVVLAGCGPLLLLLAVQYLRAGVPIAALLDTSSPGQYRDALPLMPGALRNIRTLLKGVGLLAELRRAGVRHVRHVTALEAEGENRLERVRWRCGNDPEWHSLTTPLLLLHQGVVPNTQVTRALDCTHDWDERQLSWRPRTDTWLATDVEGVSVAGDAGGIVGAKASAFQGRLAGLGAAIALGRVNEDQIRAEVKRLRRELKRETAIRPFLDTLYQPAAQWRLPEDNTVVCRCEEVTAGEVRNMANQGCRGPNQTKSFTRCGMGPCQGRMCGLTVSELLADANGQSVSETGYYRLRPPFKPITLGQLATAAEDISR
ncbi:FAD-dependent oxidoreductase [Halomonas alkalicola]|nr:MULTISPECIES: (2Fe-2S)-binding protein [unclassified Halomonas]